MMTSRGGSALPGEGHGLRRLAFLAPMAGGLLLALSLGLMVTLFFMGRTHPLHATRGWLGVFALGFLAVALWQGLFSLRLSRLPGDRPKGVLPANLALVSGLTILAAAVDAGVYLFDDFNHEFGADPTIRSGVVLLTLAVIYLTAQLQGALLSRNAGEPLGRAMLTQLRLRGEATALLSATIIGILVGTSYITAIGDDYARYWTIADALTSGWGYPASEVGGSYVAGGMNPILVDLPGLPLLMMLSFSLLGHTVLAAMLPAIVGSSLFGLFAYLAFRELTGHTLVSYAGAVMLTMFPLLSFYVLRSGEPDGLFVATLMLLAFLAIRCDRVPENRWSWPAMGAVGALAALTRPEGIAYLGVTFLTLAMAHIRTRGYWAAVLVAAAMVVPFSIVMLVTFGVPWPTNFVGTVQLDHIRQNVDGFIGWGLPGHSSALAIPQPVLVALGAVGVALYALGAVMLALRRPQLLFLAFLPAISITMFLLANPALTRPQFPYDFFRRASYGLPYLALLSSYPVALAIRGMSSFRWERLAMVLVILASASVVAYEAKLQAEPESIYEMKTQILTSGLYIMATDLVENPYPMPRMPFERRSGAAMVANSFDYLAFRNGVNGFFKPVDLHGSFRARGYALGALAVFLLGLGYAAMALTGEQRPRVGAPGVTVVPSTREGRPREA